MAKSTTIRVSTLILLILFGQVIAAIATSYRSLEIMQNRLDSRRILRELGFDSSKMKDGKRRTMTNTDRVAPEGPDPQHH